MPLVHQSKGLQHCKDIKKDALTFYYLFGGPVREFKKCLKIALEDHVRMVQEEAVIMGKISNSTLPIVREEYDPF